jgi:membrane fusion protein
MGAPASSKPALVSAYVGMLTVAILGVCALLFLASYTRKAHVLGFVVPDKGIIKIVAPRESRLAQRLVEEGATVERDALLFVLDVSGVTSAGRTGQQLAEQLIRRRDLISAEFERMPAIQAAEAQRLEMEIASLRGQLDGVAREIKARSAYLALADQALARARQLEGQAIYSVLQREKAEVDRMSGAALLASLERFQASLRGDLEKNLVDQRALGDRQENEKSRLARTLAEVEQQMIQVEEQSFLQIRAPAAGTVTRVTANVGAAVDGTAPIATILPDGAALEANLYAPSKSVGFLRMGGRVLLRYEAYP